MGSHRVQLPGTAAEVCADIVGIIESRHSEGVPLCPYKLSSLFRAMTSGGMGSGRPWLHIVHDALHEGQGWGALIECPGRRELVVLTFTESALTEACSGKRRCSGKRWQGTWPSGRLRS